MAISTQPIADLSAALVTTPVPLAHWLIIAPVVLPLALAAVLLMIRAAPRLQAAIAISGLVLLTVIDAALLRQVVAGGPVTMVMGRWLPPFGIAFTVDILGAVMTLTAAVAALAGGLYALADIDDAGRRHGFFPLLMMLMAGVGGAFLTGDLFNLYVWFEVLLISSFGLLILGSGRAQTDGAQTDGARIDGAMKYAVLNLIATTLFLIAVGILYTVFGTLNMADIATKAGELGDSAPLMTLACLFLLAFAMKAAAFPVNFWLPASYHTPRIVVSALFAGLLTKVGVYALIRVLVMLLPLEREQLSLLIAVAGAATTLLGALGALAQDDIRKLLGYVVISGIGNMLIGVAIATTGALSGTVFYAVHAMLVMTALYLAAGQAAFLGGSYSLSRLGGLYRRNGLFAALSLILFLAACGLPPFSGFWPKLILVKASLDVGAWWLAAAILIAGFVTTLAFGRVFLLAYWRPATESAETYVAIGWRPLLPLILLCTLVIGIGILPERLLALTQSAAAELTDPYAYIQSVFPGGVAP